MLLRAMTTTIQTLELRLSGITAGDYLAWCVDPEPQALGAALRALSLDADPLGDLVVATLTWSGPVPTPAAAATTAGLGSCDAVHLARELRAVDSHPPEHGAQGDDAAAA
jgi:hypothetical protein